jgi:hypothetical protein
MRRREFIAGVGGLVAWPLTARAQQPALPVIGYLGSASLEGEREFIAAFRRGLAETGYVEGRNVAIAYRWAEGQNDRLPALAADLVRLKVAVIAAPGATHSGRPKFQTFLVNFPVIREFEKETAVTVRLRAAMPSAVSAGWDDGRRTLTLNLV